MKSLVKNKGICGHWKLSPSFCMFLLGLWIINNVNLMAKVFAQTMCLALWKRQGRWWPMFRLQVSHSCRVSCPKESSLKQRIWEPALRCLQNLPQRSFMPFGKVPEQKDSSILFLQSAQFFHRSALFLQRLPVSHPHWLLVDPSLLSKTFLHLGPELWTLRSSSFWVARSVSSKSGTTLPLLRGKFSPPALFVRA